MTKCYLSPRETSCSCGCGADIRIDVRDKFNRIRERFGKPLTVSGPARCPAQNKKVGGAANSRHMHGDALDIYTVGFSDMERIRLIAIAVEIGATGIGVHKQFTHIDFGHNELTVWEY